MQSAHLARCWPHLALGTTALVMLAIATNPARGQENTSTTIVVTASVEAACSLQTDDILLDFGIYNDLTIDLTPSFTYNCPEGKDVTFSLVGGQSPDVSGFRNLPNITTPGTPPLSYRILDPSSAAWINGYNVAPTLSGDQTEVFFANMAAGQLAAVSPGQFRDEITLQMIVNN